uniref:FUS-interacting serine-arginine-rich protein 1 n=1 Tax=Pan troglodytes TaxID=9598 RepID=G2HE74_PANTR|nr:FUS-interacting serine-arginine-rich protein 1 [Pan troglodytes]
MVQYKSSIFAIIGKSCLCLFWCQCFLLNHLLCWHLCLFTCTPHAVYICLNYSFPGKFQLYLTSS